MKERKKGIKDERKEWKKEKYRKEKQGTKKMYTGSDKIERKKKSKNK